jgi:hypothetical protein
MSLLYYSRIRFITQLLPLLLASPTTAHLISVFGPGRDEKLYPEDLSLRDPTKYGFMSSGSHAAYFKTFFFEHLAAEHPGKLSLSHYFPGLVLGPHFFDDHLPKWLQFFSQYVLKPLDRLGLVTVRPEECGQRVVFLASGRYPAKVEKGPGATTSADGLAVAVSSDGVVGGGAYRSNWNNEDLPTKKHYKKIREDGMAKKSYEHTLEVFKEIDAGRVFKG